MDKQRFTDEIIDNEFEADLKSYIPEVRETIIREAGYILRELKDDNFSLWSRESVLIAALKMNRDEINENWRQHNS